jgi:predicted ATP-grasp superfamily ATP-dependent carboligase
MCNKENKIKLAVMGASKWQLPIYLKAKEMCIETHGFSYEKGAIAKDYADFFYAISLTDKERIAEKCKEIGVNGVVSCASDFATEISCWVAEKLGLNTNSYQTVVNIHDKAWVREKTKHLTSILQPITVSGSLDTIKLPCYPCIVKPVHGNGKRGVWLVKSPEDFDKIMVQADFEKNENALAEQFIIGKEYSVETLSYHSQHYVVQVTEKVSDGAPHFVELGHHQPANISDECRDKICVATKDILTAVNFTNGASHIELKVTEQGDIYLIDLNPRGGGDFISTHLVQLSTNCDFSKEIINIALDRYDASGYPYKHVAYSGVYFLTKQTEYLLQYFEQDMPCIIQKEYNRNINESISNNDRSGYMIYQDSKKLSL